MKKKLRWLLVVLVVLVIAGAATPLILRHRMQMKPSWYPLKRLTGADQAAAANRVDQKLIRTRGEIVDAYAAQVRMAKSGATTIPSTAPAPAFSLQLTEDEINSWIPKWQNELAWSHNADKYITEPAIVLDKREIILAATVKDWKTIVSLHFRPRLENDKLRLSLVNVSAGMLPLPKVSWSKYQDELVEILQKRLPELQKKAGMDADGRANSAAVSAAMSQLLIHTFNDEPSEPVLFLPDQITRNVRSLPVRITDVSVVDKTLSISVQPMALAERKALLETLRGPTDATVAQAPTSEK